MEGTRGLTCIASSIYSSKNYATVEIHARKYIVRLTHLYCFAYSLPGSLDHVPR